MVLPVPVGICNRPKRGEAASGKERGTGMMQGGGLLALACACRHLYQQGRERRKERVGKDGRKWWTAA